MPKDQPTKGGVSPLIELQALFPTGGRLTVKAPFDPKHADAVREDVKVRVRTLTAREIMSTLAAVAVVIESADGGTAYLKVANEHFDEACELLAVGTDKEGSWIGDLDGGDFLRLWKTFLGANADFFLEAADLFVGATAQKVMALIRGVGPTSSSSSPSTE